jgi:hypothetical protein
LAGGNIATRITMARHVRTEVRMATTGNRVRGVQRFLRQACQSAEPVHAGWPAAWDGRKGRAITVPATDRRNCASTHGCRPSAPATHDVSHPHERVKREAPAARRGPPEGGARSAPRDRYAADRIRTCPAGNRWRRRSPACPRR